MEIGYTILSESAVIQVVGAPTLTTGAVLYRSSPMSCSGSWRGERSSPPWRPTRREAESGSVADILASIRERRA